MPIPKSTIIDWRIGTGEKEQVEIYAFVLTGDTGLPIIEKILYNYSIIVQMNSKGRAEA